MAVPLKKNIPVLFGQTASGKTSIGIELARLLDGEIISVDSRKVYEGLPVGTATPAGVRSGDQFVVEGVAHHLMAFLKPDQPYNAGDFAADANRLIDEILERGKTPILVGGTGFYFKALQQGLPPLPKADAAIRKKFENEITANGVHALYAKLVQIDPTAAAAITSHDQHKIIRALEVLELTGRRFSDWKNVSREKPRHSFVVMGLDWNKERLEMRIRERSAGMLKDGMIEETAEVLRQGFSPHCPALESFGYREAVQVVQGTLNRDQFLTALIKGTLAYAKRQRTWFRTQIKPAWFACEEGGKVLTKQELAMRMKAFCYTASA